MACKAPIRLMLRNGSQIPIPRFSQPKASACFALKDTTTPRAAQANNASPLFPVPCASSNFGPTNTPGHPDSHVAARAKSTSSRRRDVLKTAGGLSTENQDAETDLPVTSKTEKQCCASDFGSRPVECLASQSMSEPTPFARQVENKTHDASKSQLGEEPLLPLPSPTQSITCDTGEEHRSSVGATCTTIDGLNQIDPPSVPSLSSADDSGSNSEKNIQAVGLTCPSSSASLSSASGSKSDKTVKALDQVHPVSSPSTSSPEDFGPTEELVYECGWLTVRGPRMTNKTHYAPTPSVSKIRDEEKCFRMAFERMGLGHHQVKKMGHVGSKVTSWDWGHWMDAMGPVVRHASTTPRSPPASALPLPKLFRRQCCT